MLWLQENRKFTPEQVAWLEKKFMSGANGGERIRDKKASKLMRQDFAGRMSGGRMLWLTQIQIRGWFSRRAASLKRAALERALEAIGEEGEVTDEEEGEEDADDEEEVTDEKEGEEEEVTDEEEEGVEEGD